MNFIAHAGETHQAAGETAVQASNSGDVNVFVILLISIAALTLLYLLFIFVVGGKPRKTSDKASPYKKVTKKESK